MIRVMLIMCVVASFAVSCRTSRFTSVESDKVTVSQARDSSWSKETVKVDTIRVKRESVSVTIPFKTPSGRDTLIPAQERRSGRATVRVDLSKSGITATATCDSLEFLILQKTLEIGRLQFTLDSVNMERNTTDNQTRVIYKIPWGWIIPALIVLLGILAYAFFKIKKFIL